MCCTRCSICTTIYKIRAASYVMSSHIFPSSSSNRLRALQEEIERLKEGVARANERANQPPPPAQIYHIPGPGPAAAAAAQQQPQEPGYYDPFDDPYGFMRMPRRRANSFSGGREREWDEWYWTLPQNRQYDGGDIPLGYAAADAYADLPVSSAQQETSRDSFKNKLRQRRMTNERQRRDMQVSCFSCTIRSTWKLQTFLLALSCPIIITVMSPLRQYLLISSSLL